MSTNPGQSGSEDLRLPFDPVSAFEQAPAFSFPEDYNPLFPMGDPAPLEPLDHLDPEETFDVLFGTPTPEPAEDPGDDAEDEPDLASMKLAKPAMPVPHLPLPPT